MIIDQSLVARVVVPRQTESHKGSYGRVLLVGACIHTVVLLLWQRWLAFIVEQVW